jgi:hypothetical protein
MNIEPANLTGQGSSLVLAFAFANYSRPTLLFGHLDSKRWLKTYQKAAFYGRFIPNHLILKLTVHELSGLRHGCSAIFLRSVSHDQANHTAGQHDREIVSMLHLGDGEGQEQPHTQAKYDAQRQRLHFAGEHADQDTGDDSFECGANHDSQELAPDFWREPGRKSVKDT